LDFASWASFLAKLYPAKGSQWQYLECSKSFVLKEEGLGPTCRQELLFFATSAEKGEKQGKWQAAKKILR
jgi:hypothetical protein